MIVFLEFWAHGPCLDMDDEQVAIVICKLLSTGSAFGCGHETEHLEEISFLEKAEVSFLHLSPSVEGHLRQLVLDLFEVAAVELLYGVVDLVEGEDAGLELFGRFEGSQH